MSLQMHDIKTIFFCEASLLLYCIRCSLYDWFTFEFITSCLYRNLEGIFHW